ncbi:MAG: hypothetical protein WB992_05740, partial [Bryobacteraceae bacterium]
AVSIVETIWRRQVTSCCMTGDDSRSPAHGPGDSPALIEAAVILLIPAALTWFGLIEVLKQLCSALGG